MLTLFELFCSAFFISFSFFIWERRSHTSFLSTTPLHILHL